MYLVIVVIIFVTEDSGIMYDPLLVLPLSIQLLLLFLLLLLLLLLTFNLKNS